MNRHLNRMDKHITWKGLLAPIGICIGIVAVINAISDIMCMKPIWWQATKDFTKRLFKR